MLRVICSVGKLPSLIPRYTILRTNPKHERKTKFRIPPSSPNRPSKDESPGTSFENPLVDFRAQLDLTATRYYALDPTNGIIKTTEAGVPKFYRGNVAILNSDGMRMHVSYDPGRNTYTIVIRYPEQAKDVLSRLNDPHWEFIDVDTALEEAEDDDTIHYGKTIN